MHGRVVIYIFDCADGCWWLCNSGGADENVDERNGGGDGVCGATDAAGADGGVDAYGAGGSTGYDCGPAAGFLNEGHLRVIANDGVGGDGETDGVEVVDGAAGDDGADASDCAGDGYDGDDG